LFLGVWLVKLYDFQLSGNCYKVRLFLNILGLRYQAIPLDLMAGDQRQPEFLALNPKGQVPVLVDEGATVADAQAILVYLARRNEAADWLPTDPESLAHIQFWLSTASNEIANGPARARLYAKFGMEGDVAAAEAIAARLFQWLDPLLGRRDWLVGARPTIAEMAVYPYIALAHEGNLSLESFGAIRRWLERCGNLPGYIGMPGLLS